MRGAAGGGGPYIFNGVTYLPYYFVGFSNGGLTRKCSKCLVFSDLGSYICDNLLLSLLDVQYGISKLV